MWPIPVPEAAGCECCCVFGFYLIVWRWMVANFQTRCLPETSIYAHNPSSSHRKCNEMHGFGIQLSNLQPLRPHFLGPQAPQSLQTPIPLQNLLLHHPIMQMPRLMDIAKQEAHVEACSLEVQKLLQDVGSFYIHMA